MIALVSSLILHFALLVLVCHRRISCATLRGQSRQTVPTTARASVVRQYYSRENGTPTKAVLKRHYRRRYLYLREFPKFWERKTFSYFCPYFEKLDMIAHIFRKMSFLLACSLYMFVVSIEIGIEMRMGMHYVVFQDSEIATIYTVLFVIEGGIPGSRENAQYYCAD